MRAWLSSPIAVAIVVSTLRAHANPSAHLVYVRGLGADRCPNEDALRASVTTRLGYDPFFLSAPTTIFVEVLRDGDRFAALVKLIDDQGVERGARHLAATTGDCADLIGTLALTISLVVDPVSLPVSPAASDSTAARPATPVDPPTAPTPMAPPTVPIPVGQPATVADGSPTPRRPDAPRFFAGVAVLGSLGSALAPTAGAAVFGGARRGWVSVRVEVRGDLPASAPKPPPARSWALIASAVPCVHWRSTFACATLGLESIRASGEAVVPRKAETLVALVGGRLGAEIAGTDRFAVAAFAEWFVPLPRPRIEMDGTSIHGFSPVAGDVGISGLERF
jgi:hypothetical protein